MNFSQLISIFLLSICLSFCIEVSGNNVYIDANITIDADLCLLIESVETEPEDNQKKDGFLKEEWEICEYNEECESGLLCVCTKCVDITQFIEFGFEDL